MEVNVIVKVETTEIAEKLIRAFFEDLDDNSKMEIKGREFNISIVYESDAVPVHIIDVLKECQEVNFYPHPRKNEATLKNTIKEKKDGEYGYDKIKEFVNSSNSYSEFKEKIIDWVDFGRYKNFFESIIFSAEQCLRCQEKINWKNIPTKMERYTDWERIVCAKIVRKKFEEFNERMPILTFIQTIVGYIDNEFNHYKEETVDMKKPEESVSEEKTEKSENIKKSAIENTEHAILYDLIEDVPKNYSKEDKIKYLLSKMEWNESENPEIWNIVKHMLDGREVSSRDKIVVSRLINSYMDREGDDTKIKTDFFIAILKEML